MAKRRNERYRIADTVLFIKNGYSADPHLMIISAGFYDSLTVIPTASKKFKNGFEEAFMARMLELLGNPGHNLSHKP